MYIWKPTYLSIFKSQLQKLSKNLIQNVQMSKTYVVLQARIYQTLIFTKNWILELLSSRYIVFNEAWTTSKPFLDNEQNLVHETLHNKACT